MMRRLRESTIRRGNPPFASAKDQTVYETRGTGRGLFERTVPKRMKRWSVPPSAVGGRASDRIDQVRDIALDPVRKANKKHGRLDPWQCILHVRRHDRQAAPFNQPVAHELTEALSQRAFADAVHAPAQLGEPHPADFQRYKNQGAPLARDSYNTSLERRWHHPASAALQDDHPAWTLKLTFMRTHVSLFGTLVGRAQVDRGCQCSPSLDHRSSRQVGHLRVADAGTSF